ncbi:MAG: type II restriction endonuclease, partial [Flavobacteriaceae bacterium]|nr:type II restriction endonuclease [Flavobacteriaceae bacterium]
MPLKDWDINIYRGVLTGYNEAFIIDGKKKDELIAEDPKSAEIIRPILRGRDIKRYGYEFADLWLLYIPWHFPLHKNSNITGVSEEAEKEFQKQYPDIYNHLLKHKKELSARNKAETGIRYEWYALQRWGANYWEDLDRQKVVWKRVGSILRFCYDENKHTVLDSTCFATGKNLKYLLGILNSKLGNYMLQDSPKTGTGDLLISVQAIEPLKIPMPDTE